MPGMLSRSHSYGMLHGSDHMLHLSSLIPALEKSSPTNYARGPVSLSMDLEPKRAVS